MELTVQELFNQIQKKLIIKLKDNEKICPICKGLRFTYKQEGEHGYINSCTDCYNGKVYECKYCGKLNKTDWCDCEGANNERIKQEQQKELERFNKANKIKYKDYNGKFIWNNRVIDIEEVRDNLYYMIKNKEETPNYLYAIDTEPVFSRIDLEEIVREKCEDGYEDMETYLYFNDTFNEAQKLLDKWIEEQGETLDCYYEDYKIVVLLDDLIEDIKNDIKEGK